MRSSTKPKRKMLTVRLPVEVARAIERIAKRAGTTPSLVINVLLAAAMERMDRAAPVPDPVRRPRPR